MPEPDPRRWLALLTCCSALFMTLLDVSVTNVALPSIADATGAVPSQLQWVVSGYTLAFGLVPVITGRLGDDHGRRLMFQVGAASFAATSLLAAVAPSIGVLIAARVLQGLAGGLINPQVTGMIQQMFPGHERARAFGIVGTMVGVGSALGPLVGGAFIALGGVDLGWRLVFFINVPIGIAVIVLARRLLPADGARGHHRLDVPGAAMLGGATFCVLFASVEYDALPGWLLGTLPVVMLSLLGLFVQRERRLTRLRRDPLLDLRLFRVPSYTAGWLLALLFFPVIAGIPLVLTLYFQQGLGYTALEAGLGATSYALGNAIGAPLAGRFVMRVGRALLVAATVTSGVGAILLAVLVAHAPAENVALVLAPALFIMGAATGAVMTPNQALSLLEVDPAMGGTAGGVLQTAQRMGLALGQAVIGAAFFASIGTTGPTAARYGSAFGTAVVVALAFVVLASGVGVVDLVRTRRRERVA